MQKWIKCLFGLVVVTAINMLFCSLVEAEQPVIFSVVTISKQSGIVRLKGSGFGKDPQVILTNDSGSQKIRPQFNNGTWLSFRLPLSATGNFSVSVVSEAKISNQLAINTAWPSNLNSNYSASRNKSTTINGSGRTVSETSVSVAGASIQPSNLSVSSVPLNIGSSGLSTSNDSSVVPDAQKANQPLWGGAIVKPLIFNAPFSAKADDIVGLQGENFGGSPKVQLVSVDGAMQDVPIINTYGGVWVSFRVPATVRGVIAARVTTDVASSDLVKLNSARPYHLDATVIVPGGAFRVFGRSLLVSGIIPKVLVNGSPALVDVLRSSEHMLVVTAPSIINGGNTAEISVSNHTGDGFAKLDRNVSIMRIPQADPFGLGVGWAAGFKGIAENILDPRNNPSLRNHLSCDGRTDDSVALNESVSYLAGVGGGVIQLPAGQCYLKSSVALSKNIVIQGAGKDTTTLLYSGNIPIIGTNVEFSGVRNLTLRNVGATRGPVLERSRFVLMQNLRIELGVSEQMWFANNQNFVFKNCDIVLKDSTNLHGPYIFNASSGLVFEGNTTRFGSGTTTFEGVHDAVLYNNVFERDASTQYSNAGTIHTVALDFAYRIAVIKNQLNVVNGKVTNKGRNDGEAILTEGGGARRTENLGIVQAADATSFTDKGNTLNVDPFQQNKIPENYGVAIVAGKGMGQTRGIVAYSNGKAIVDKEWDSIPDVTSRYATFVWGLEKSTIAGNQLNGNPRGIWLYQTALREVDVVGNQISEGGGIYLRSAQKVPDKLFTPVFGVRVADNQISNQTGTWGSYLNNLFIQMDPSDFGVGSVNIEFRNNLINANYPNVNNPGEDSSSGEGLKSMGRLETRPYTPLNLQTRILGTVIQGNKCLNCPVPEYQMASQGAVFSQ